MTVAQAAALGALQGATEFLPVSSSGHLVVAQHALGFRQPEVLFDVVLHGGTLAALLAYYGRDLLRLSRRWWADLAVATVVTAAIALPAKNLIEGLFARPDWVGAAFLATGALLFATRRADGARADLGPGAAALVGVAQAVAVAPGISRSGATLAAALLLGVRREAAARFAFLLAIPAIAGALVIEGKHAPRGSAGAATFAVGAVAAALVGYAGLRAAVSVVAGGRVHRFAYYLWPLGLAVLLWTAFKR